MAAADWADAVAVLHGLAVAFLVTGGLLALRWPCLVRAHLPVAAAALAVNLTGSDCPLTVWELRLRVAAGETPYTGGFVGAYLVEPLLARPLTPGLAHVVLAVAVVPNVLAYAAVLVRRSARSSTPAGTRRRTSTSRPTRRTARASSTAFSRRRRSSGGCRRGTGPGSGRRSSDVAAAPGARAARRPIGRGRGPCGPGGPGRAGAAPLLE